MRGELETGTDCYILTQSSSDHSSTSFASRLGCSTVGHWGPQALSLQADSHAGILSPTDSNGNSNWTRTDTDSSRLWHLVIFLFDAHLLPVSVRICTEFNHVHRSRWYSDIFNRMHLFCCSSAYLHRCISWLTTRSKVSMLQNELTFTGLNSSCIQIMDREKSQAQPGRTSSVSNNQLLNTLDCQLLPRLELPSWICGLLTSKKENHFSCFDHPVLKDIWKNLTPVYWLLTAPSAHYEHKKQPFHSHQEILLFFFLLFILSFKSCQLVKLPL